MHIVMFGFIGFEVICGYFAIRIMTNYQVTKFHLRQFTDLDQLNQGYEHSYENVQDVKFSKRA